MVIGFVGLGIMGKPMAKNLCRAGYSLIVNDHHDDNVKELTDMGAEYGDAEKIGKASDIVITMLPNSPQVKEVMLGTSGDGIASYMRPGTCFIDMSSINPVDSRYIGDVLSKNSRKLLLYMVVLRDNHSAAYPVAKRIHGSLCHLPCRFSYRYKHYLSFECLTIKSSLYRLIRKNSLDSCIYDVIRYSSKLAVHVITLLS